MPPGDLPVGRFGGVGRPAPNPKTRHMPTASVGMAPGAIIALPRVYSPGAKYGRGLYHSTETAAVVMPAAAPAWMSKGLSPM